MIKNLQKKYFFFSLRRRKHRPRNKTSIQLTKFLLNETYQPSRSQTEKRSSKKVIKSNNKRKREKIHFSQCATLGEIANNFFMLSCFNLFNKYCILTFLRLFLPTIECNVYDFIVEYENNIETFILIAFILIAGE